MKTNEKTIGIFGGSTKDEERSGDNAPLVLSLSSGWSFCAASRLVSSRCRSLGQIVTYRETRAFLPHCYREREGSAVQRAAKRVACTAVTSLCSLMTGPWTAFTTTAKRLLSLPSS
jgi:hypothetical protein